MHWFRLTFRHINKPWGPSFPSQQSISERTVQLWNRKDLLSSDIDGIGHSMKRHSFVSVDHITCLGIAIARLADGTDVDQGGNRSELKDNVTLGGSRKCFWRHHPGNMRVPMETYSTALLMESLPSKYSKNSRFPCHHHLFTMDSYEGNRLMQTLPESAPTPQSLPPDWSIESYSRSCTRLETFGKATSK